MGQFIKITFLHICPKVTKKGSTIGHRIEYNRVGFLEASGTSPAKIYTSTPPPPSPLFPGSSGRCTKELSLFEAEAKGTAFESAGYRFQLVVLEIGPLNYFCNAG